jgi:hypothetical protein
MRVCFIKNALADEFKCNPEKRQNKWVWLGVGLNLLWWDLQVYCGGFYFAVP